jgi:hypothetical protein
MKEISQILQKPIREFETLEEFKKMCIQNNFETLADIVKYPVTELMKKPGFGMRVFRELLRILIENKIDNVLKD